MPGCFASRVLRNNYLLFYAGVRYNTTCAKTVHEAQVHVPVSPCIEVWHSNGIACGGRNRHLYPCCLHWDYRPHSSCSSRAAHSLLMFTASSSNERSHDPLHVPLVLQRYSFPFTSLLG